MRRKTKWEVPEYTCIQESRNEFAGVFCCGCTVRKTLRYTVYMRILISKTKIMPTNQVRWGVFKR